MTEHRSVRYGILGVVAALALGLVWLGIVRYQAEQRARAAALPPAVSTADSVAAAVDVPAAAVPAPVVEKVMVHVAGAVVKPGVYQLEKGARVIDALTAAGGALAEGVPDALNLAALVEDGQKVFVSTKQELTSPPPPAARDAAFTPYAASVSSGTKAPAGKVNVNTATAEQLDQVSGISPALARAIVEYRTQHGPFKKLDDLDNVKGVGAATLKKLKEHLTL